MKFKNNIIASLTHPTIFCFSPKSGPGPHFLALFALSLSDAL